MWGWLERIVNAQQPKGWLSQHRGATLRRRQSVKGGYVLTYEDAHTGGVAIYHTDDIGNVQRVDVLR